MIYNEQRLGGGFNHFLIFTLKKMIQFEYFSDGLKPPTRQSRSFSLSQERPGISALRLQVQIRCRNKICKAGNTWQNASNCEFGGLKQKLIIVLVREREVSESNFGFASFDRSYRYQFGCFASTFQFSGRHFYIGHTWGTHKFCNPSRKVWFNIFSHRWKPVTTPSIDLLFP